MSTTGSSPDVAGRQDWYGPYPEGTARDPRGPAEGDLRVIRGGSWYFDGNSARCGLRYTHAPDLAGFSLGFHLVRGRRCGIRTPAAESAAAVPRPPGSTPGTAPRLRGGSRR